VRLTYAVSFRRVYSGMTPQEWADGMDALEFHKIPAETRERDHSIIVLVRPTEAQIDAFEEAVGYSE
jgi:hypothetical protein